MLMDSVRFPTRGDDAIKTLLIGTGLVVLSIVPLVNIVVGLALSGHQLRTIRAGAAGDPTPPTFSDFGGLIGDGLRTVAVLLAYSLVSAIIVGGAFVASVFVVPVGMAAGGGVGGTAGGALAGGTSILALVIILGGLLLALVPLYFVPASLLGLATQDRLGAAFDVGAIRQIAFSTEYVVGMIVVALTILAINVLAAILIGLPLIFYLQMIVFHFIGQMGARAADNSRTGGTPTASPT
jgi:hypothetical protein